MKSRSFLYICFSLMLLFSQQIAFAGALDHVQKTAFDHQCAYEEGDAADSHLSKHLLIDEYDDAPMAALVVPQFANVAVPHADWAFAQFLHIVAPHYFSRAPPLA